MSPITGSNKAASSKAPPWRNRRGMAILSLAAGAVVWLLWPPPPPPPADTCPDGSARIHRPDGTDACEGSLVPTTKCDPASLPSDCFLLFATVGESIAKDSERSMGTLLPPGYRSATAVSALGIWIRNLLYPPIMQYCVDEIGARAPSNKEYANYRSSYFGLSCAPDEQPTCLQTTQASTTQFIATASCGVPAGRLCADGYPPAPMYALDASLRAMEQLLVSTGTGLVDQHKVEVEAPAGAQTLLARIETQGGGVTALLSIILSNLREFREGTDLKPISCGPFRLASQRSDDAPGIDPATGMVRFVRDPGWGGGSGLPEFAGLDSLGARRRARYCFKEFPTIAAAAAPNADFDVMIAPFDPYSKAKTSLPPEISRASLTVGRHVFAVLNAQRFQDPATRRGLYSGILRPSVESLVKDRVIARVDDAPADYWFPRRWESTANLFRPGNDFPALPGFAFSASLAPLVPVNRTLTVACAGASIPCDPDRTPILAEIKSRLRQFAGVPDVTTLKDGSRWEDADIVLFESEFDPKFGDPTSLLLSYKTELRTVAPTGQINCLELLDQTSSLLMLQGPNHHTVLTQAVEVQRVLNEAAFVYPLYAVPYFVFWRPNRIAHLEMNYRAGFVNFEKWVLGPERSCQ